MAFSLPERGFVFWPVGCGDSTTVVIGPDVVVQVDIQQVGAADDESDPRIPVLDVLLPLLPERDGRPYLAAFGATHLDQDHIKGFAELLEKATIGDLWFTPRVLWEEADAEGGLCDDAKAFRDEAERRIEIMKEHGEVGSGDRIRIIGYHQVLREHSDIYEDLPEGAVTVPGSEFFAIDGEDLKGQFRAFVHAPFQEDGEGDRNDTSFALQITLGADPEAACALLLGDLGYPTLQRIVSTSIPPNEEISENLLWNILLAPHHCSKRAMYWQGPDDEEPELQRGLLDAFERHALESNFIIASSSPIPDEDVAGANPPHAKAANRYREITQEFLCTGEEPSVECPQPLVFELPDSGGSLALRSGGDVGGAGGGAILSDAARRARGGSEPPRSPVGYG